MAKQIDTGGSAFPRPASAIGGETCDEQAGMTLRDWFAGQALAGIMARPAHSDGLDKTERCIWAYEHADAMIAARKAKGGGDDAA